MHKRLTAMWLALGCVGVLGATATVAAQTHRSTVEQRLEALEARVAALEKHEHLGDVAPPSATAGVPTRHRAQPGPATPPAPGIPPHPVAASDWSALHRGMSRQQVVSALGNPDGKQVRPMTETWFYPGDRSVQFDRNGTLDTWTGQ